MDIHVYAELIAAHPTPEGLLAYLQSEEGGALCVAYPADPQTDPHVLIHYGKLRSEQVATSASVPKHVRAFRSVVWCTRTHRPVALSPLKAEPEESLEEVLRDAGAATTLIAEEFVDGVMVNMWHDGSRWRVATRTRLDATSGYHSRRSFADLFTEAFAATGLSQEAHLQQGLCYTWALQHPQNRIVAPVAAPRVVLLQVATMVDGGEARILDVRTTAVVAAGVAPVPTYPCFAGAEGFTLASVRERVVSEGDRLGLAFQGLVFKDYATGRRWRLRSPTYAGVKELRGNEPDIDFVLLSRAVEGRLGAYLQAYPEEAVRAAELQGAYDAAAAAAEAWYGAVFKARRVPLNSVPAALQPLLRALEEHYKEVVRPEGATMTPATCECVLAAQDPARKLWVVRRVRAEGGVVHPAEGARPQKRFRGGEDGGGGLDLQRAPPPPSWSQIARGTAATTQSAFAPGGTATQSAFAARGNHPHPSALAPEGGVTPPARRRRGGVRHRQRALAREAHA